MAIFDKLNEFELRPIGRRKFPNSADESQIGVNELRCSVNTARKLEFSRR